MPLTRTKRCPSIALRGRPADAYDIAGVPLGVPLGAPPSVERCYCQVLLSGWTESEHVTLQCEAGNTVKRNSGVLSPGTIHTHLGKKLLLGLISK